MVWSSILSTVPPTLASSDSIRCSSSLEIAPVRTVKSAVSAVCTTASAKPASATASRAWSTVMSLLTV